MALPVPGTRGRGARGRWIRENPPGEGVGWDAHPLALRIANWIKWSLAGGELSPIAAHSLAVQTRYLAEGLELRPPDETRFAAAKALVFAGLFFRGHEAEPWLRRGRALLQREIGAQVLPDGGHRGRSPMHHSLRLEDLLDLQNLAYALREPRPYRWGLRPDLWRRTIAGMRRWLAAMCHPDGEISFFGDAAFGVAPSPGELDAYARRLGLEALPAASPGVHYLADTGFVRIQTADAVALLDVGRLGPGSGPDSNHAAGLGFELSLYGERALVHPGRSSGEPAGERTSPRAAAAHNTVVVDGEDSSGVRPVRRARPRGLEIEEGPGEARVRAHDGCRHLPGRVQHRREWLLGPGRLRVHDSLSGRYSRASAHLHLHPRVVPDGNGELLLARGGRPLGVGVRGGRRSSEPAMWHPRLGISLPTRRLRIDFEGPELETELGW